MKTPAAVATLAKLLRVATDPDACAEVRTFMNANATELAAAWGTTAEKLLACVAEIADDAKLVNATKGTAKSLRAKASAAKQIDAVGRVKSELADVIETASTWIDPKRLMVYGPSLLESACDAPRGAHIVFRSAAGGVDFCVPADKLREFVCLDKVLHETVVDLEARVLVLRWATGRLRLGTTQSPDATKDVIVMIPAFPVIEVESATDEAPAADMNAIVAFADGAAA